MILVMRSVARRPKRRTVSTNDGGKEKTMINFHKYNGGGWIRLFGFLLRWKNTEKWPMTFSEKYGHAKVLRLGKFMVAFR